MTTPPMDRPDKDVDESARDAGEYAAAVAGVDPEVAAPIPADDTETLATPGTESSAPAG